MASRPSLRTACFSRLFWSRPSGASTVPLAGLGAAPDKGDIGAVQRAGAAVVGELGGEVLVRLLGLGRDHDARGVLVEPVHDARALDAANAHQAVAAMEEQGVDQRAGRVARGRVHHHADRLVDDDQLVVLVEDVERDVLGVRLGIFGSGATRMIVSPSRQLVFGLADGLPVDRDGAGQYQVLDAVAREHRHGAGQRGIEPARRPRRHRPSTVHSCLLAGNVLHERSSRQARNHAPELSPEALAILSRARKSFMMSIGLLLVGFIAIGGALVYRASQSEANGRGGPTTSSLR